MLIVTTRFITIITITTTEWVDQRLQRQSFALSRIRFRPFNE
jgi:hypothetical protein